MKKLTVLSSALSMAFLAAAATLVLAQSTATGSQVKADHPVQIELTSKLETKSAAVGTPVMAKLLEPAGIAGTTLPKGAKLTGKVTAVTPGQSITIAFDTIEAKGKAAEAIHADVLSVAPKPSLSDAGPSASSIPMRNTAVQQAGTTGMGQQVQSDGLPDLPVGSTIKGVTLAPPGDAASATLTYSKNFKLDSGARMEVGLWKGSK